LGIGLTLVLTLTLLASFALPTGAAVEKLNEWYKFDYPKAGSTGDWFRQGTTEEVIDAVGPMAQAINGDLYTYVNLGNGGTHHLFKSEDGGRTWAESTADDKYAGGPIVDMVCSSIDEDIIYVTDGNYVYKSDDAGDEFAFVAKDSLEEALMGACGIDIVGEPITSLDVGYDDDDRPFVFIGTAETGIGGGSVYWIGEAGYPAKWTDLDLSCYGAYDVYSVGVAPDFADSKETYAVVSRIATVGANLSTDTAEWATDSDRGYVAKLTKGSTSAYDSVYVQFIPAAGITISDFTALADTWGFSYYLQSGWGPQFELKFTDPDSASYVDITLMLDQTNPTLLTWTDVTASGTSQGLYYGDQDPGGSFSDATLQNLSGIEADIDATITGTCGDWELTRVRVELWETQGGRYCFIDDITIDGTTYELPGETHVVSTKGVTCSWTEFDELKQDCVNPFGIVDASRIGFPDDWEDTETLFVGVVGKTVGGDVYSVTSDGAVDRNVEGIGTAGGCVGLKDANIISLDVMGDTDEASLIAGAYDDTDVYYSTDGGWSWDVSEKNPTGEDETYVLWYGDSAVAATSGCECAFSMSCGEEVGQYWNQISLIATDIDGVFDIAHSPGYVVDSETLFMLSWCVEDYCQDTTSSLFRYDGEYWERVFSDTIYVPVDGLIEMVEVSPDFNSTNAVFVANANSEVWRTQDAGCSWDKLTFPCAPRPWILSAVVIDEDTMITGGFDGSVGNDSGTVFKTTRHGARLWDDYEVTDAGNIMSFDLEPGYEDPGTVLLGDNLSQVFISEDGGETWDLVGDCQDVFVTTDQATSVAFDPDYATNHTIYAAAGNVIARCIIDPEADWADQEWEEIYSNSGDVYWGIQDVGDTALYVTATSLTVEEGAVAAEASGSITVRGADSLAEGTKLVGTQDITTLFGAFIDGEVLNVTGSSLTATSASAVSGTIEVEGAASGASGTIDVALTGLSGFTTDETVVVIGSALEAVVTAPAGPVISGVLRTLNPLEEEPEDVVFEQLTEELDEGAVLYDLFLTTDVSEDGCAENVLWSLSLDVSVPALLEDVWVWEDTLAAPVVLTTPVAEQKVGTTDEVTLSWTALCGADCYEVSLWSYCPECPDLKEEVNISDLMDCHYCGEHEEYECVEDTCLVVDGLESGTTYYWKVRVCYGEPKLSKWSEERTFTTALLDVTELCSPVCGGQDIILTPNFSWDKVDGATGYEVQLATTETFTAGMVKGKTTVNAWVAPDPLEYATTYYWRVRALKDSVYSDWTVCLFTTMAEPVPPTPPVEITIPPAPPPTTITIPPATMITPTWIYAIIGVGAALAIVVIALIVRTRRPPA